MKECKSHIDKIYVVSLERCTERRVQIEKQFEREKIDFEYFSAVDAANVALSEILSEFRRLSKRLPEDAVLADGSRSAKYYADRIKSGELPSGPFLTPASIACTLSHCLLYEKILAQRPRNVIVFEDDVIVAANFREKFDRVLSELDSTPIEGAWDILHLGSHYLTTEEDAQVGYYSGFRTPVEDPTQQGRQFVYSEDGTRLNYVLSGCWELGGTHGYALSLRGAEFLHSYPFISHADVLTSRISTPEAQKQGLRVYVASPLLCYAAKGASEIAIADRKVVNLCLNDVKNFHSEQ